MKPFIYFAICLFAFATIFLFLAVYKSKKKRKNKRAPFSDKFLRGPGQSLNDQIQSLNEDITSNSVYLVIFPLLVLSHLFIINTRFLYFTVIIIAIILFFDLIFFIRLWKTLSRRNRLQLGYYGEVAVGQELNMLMLDGYHVYHDFLTDKFNIDHVIICSSGVYAVETKARSKTRRGIDSGNIEYDGKSIQFPDGTTDSSPLNQAIRQAAWLRKWLSSAVGDKIDVEPIVALPGWYINRTAKHGIAVLNPKLIGIYIKNKKEKPLSNSMIQRIVHQIDQKCRDIEPLTVQIEEEEIIKGTPLHY